MRRGKLEYYLSSANQEAARSVPQSEQDCSEKAVQQRSKSNGQTKVAASKASGKAKSGKTAAKFAPLPLQQARVLQQLQSFSLSSNKVKAPAAQEGTATAPAAQHAKSLRRKPSLLRHHRLHSSNTDAAGNTDSEVESPLSQIPRRSERVASPAELSSKPSPLSETASAVTPARTARQVSDEFAVDSGAASPESVVMSTPACGQHPSGSEVSPLFPMSCSSACVRSAEQFRPAGVPKLHSPMCISPDTWATPQQLQWETSPDGIPAITVPFAAQLPTESQLQAANLQFGFDAIQHAATASHSKSRLASTKLADQLSESPHQMRGPRRLGVLDENAEWIDDLEATPSTSSSAEDEQVAEQQSGLANTCIAKVSAGTGTQLLLSLDNGDLLSNTTHHLKIPSEQPTQLVCKSHVLLHCNMTVG